MTYKSLDSQKTIETVEQLQRRISERFPESSLEKVCATLSEIAHHTREKTEWISKPYYWLRIVVALIIIISFVILLYSISQMNISIKSIHFAEFVQVSEAALNDVVLIGAAIFFLISVETRIKRERVLELLHELRSIAHVIDMHQLTKDPSKISPNVILTTSSPKETLSVYELMRYLDYCSELLSLTGKVAALYAQSLRDAVVLSSVNEIETLTTGLSRKIWQKIMILHKLEDEQSRTQ
ncbi:MAG: hypothetical protein OEY19_14130 [Gammaproteobacteria bacterium]|nr:hypothetical protein [Gammaproteobacteria bacterium]